MLYNANVANNAGPAASIWSSGTYNKGTAPCALTVSGDAGGSITVDDTHGMQLFYAAAGVLFSGQQLLQVLKMSCVLPEDRCIAMELLRTSKPRMCQMSRLLHAIRCSGCRLRMFAATRTPCEACPIYSDARQ